MNYAPNRDARFVRDLYPKAENAYCRVRQLKEVRDLRKYRDDLRQATERFRPPVRTFVSEPCGVLHILDEQPEVLEMLAKRASTYHPEQKGFA